MLHFSPSCTESFRLRLVSISISYNKTISINTSYLVKIVWKTCSHSWFFMNRECWNTDGPSCTSCSASVRTRRNRPAGCLYEIFRSQKITSDIVQIIFNFNRSNVSKCEPCRIDERSNPCWSLQVCSYGSLFAQALPRDVHSTPFYYARPQSLPLSYPERSAAAHNSSMATSGISSMGVFSINGPGPTPPSLLTGWVTVAGYIFFIIYTICIFLIWYASVLVVYLIGLLLTHLLLMQLSSTCSTYDMLNMAMYSMPWINWLPDPFHSKSAGPTASLKCLNLNVVICLKLTITRSLVNSHRYW